MDPSIKKYLQRHWNTHKKVSEMAVKLGMDEPSLRRLAIRLKLGPRPKPVDVPPDPSEKEIEALTAAIRESWTPAERNQRWCGARKVRWKAPLIRVGEIEPPTFSRMR